MVQNTQTVMGMEQTIHFERKPKFNNLITEANSQLSQIQLRDTRCSVFFQIIKIRKIRKNVERTNQQCLF